MAAPRKLRRTRATATSSPALPVDLLVTIAERTDAVTIVRCAAASKLLRREIVSPEFVRRVCQDPDDAVVPSRVLGWLGAESFSVVHPLTVPAFSFAGNHLAPFASRGLAQILDDKYTFVTSRGGLVVLKRRGVSRPRRRSSELCVVYDPMTGDRAFLPASPDLGDYHGLLCDVTLLSYVILTAAADGIGCRFMLLAADMSCRFDGFTCPRFQIASSDAGGEWGPINCTEHRCPGWCGGAGSYCDAAVVLDDGVVHWLMHARYGEAREYILTYDVATGTAGSVDLPKDSRVANASGSKLLGTSPDGKKLSLAVTDRFVVSVWVLSSSGGGQQWARQLEIDTMELWTAAAAEGARGRGVKLESFGDQRSGKVFLRIGDDSDTVLVLDMETGRASMRWLVENLPGPGTVPFPYEVDLASRLSSMKTF